MCVHMCMYVPMDVLDLTTSSFKIILKNHKILQVFSYLKVCIPPSI